MFLEDSWILLGGGRIRRPVCTQRTPFKHQRPMAAWDTLESAVGIYPIWDANSSKSWKSCRNRCPRKCAAARVREGRRWRGCWMITQGVFKCSPSSVLPFSSSHFVSSGGKDINSVFNFWKLQICYGQIVFRLLNLKAHYIKVLIKKKVTGKVFFFLTHNKILEICYNIIFLFDIYYNHDPLGFFHNNVSLRWKIIDFSVRDKRYLVHTPSQIWSRHF